MRFTGVVLAGLLALGLSACSKSSTTGGGGGDGGNASKILGTWTAQEGPDKGVSFEFQKEGKLKILSEKGEEAAKGTYTLEGDKLTMKIEGDKDAKPDTIVKLTDSELELKDEKGKVEKFKKK